MGKKRRREGGRAEVGCGDGVAGTTCSAPRPLQTSMSIRRWASHEWSLLHTNTGALLPLPRGLAVGADDRYGGHPVRSTCYGTLDPGLLCRPFPGAVLRLSAAVQAPYTWVWEPCQPCPKNSGESLSCPAPMHSAPFVLVLACVPLGEGGGQCWGGLAQWESDGCLSPKKGAEENCSSHWSRHLSLDPCPAPRAVLGMAASAMANDRPSLPVPGTS